MQTSSLQLSFANVTINLFWFLLGLFADKLFDKGMDIYNGLPKHEKCIGKIIDVESGAAIPNVRVVAIGIPDTQPDTTNQKGEFFLSVNTKIHNYIEYQATHLKGKYKIKEGKILVSPSDTMTLPMIPYP